MIKVLLGSSHILLKQNNKASAGTFNVPAPRHSDQSFETITPPSGNTATTISRSS